MFAMGRHRVAPQGPPCYCNNDQCPHHYNGIPAHQLAFGCFSCNPPSRYETMPDEWKKAIKLDRLHDLFDAKTQLRDREHGGMPVKPRCPVCFEPLDCQLFTPPWGVWSQSRGGKSVLDAATYISLTSDLWRKTGISHRVVRDVGDYIPKVIQPLLQDGIIPEKTQPSQRHSLVLLFERVGWLSRKGTLTDVAGETFADLINPQKDTPQLRLGRALMLHSKQAIFVANPEWSDGIGASIRRDLWAAIRRCFTALQRRAGAQLALRSAEQIQALPDQIDAVLRGWDFPVRGFGGGDLLLAAEIARLAEAETNRELVIHLAQLLATTRQEMQNMPSLTKQIQEIIAFFNTWGTRIDGKYDVALAFTVSKSDLLDGIVPNYAHCITGLGPESSSKQWRAALELVSRESERVFFQDEHEAVELVKNNFHRVAFFFVSALGRDAVPLVVRGKATRSTIAHAAAESAPWMADQAKEQPLPCHGSDQPESDDDLPWRLQKVVARGPDGTRTPEPRNVLLPLLWLLGQQ